MFIQLSVPTWKSQHNSLCRLYNRDSRKYFRAGVLGMSYIQTITFVLLGFIFSFFLIILSLSFGSQTQPQFFFFFCEVPLLSRALFRHEKSQKILSNSESYFASFQTQSLSAVFAQILYVIRPCILRVFLQKTLPSLYFRHHSPQGRNYRCRIGIFFFSAN